MIDETKENREKRILDYFTEKKKIPKGYRREMIIIEDKAYSLSIKESTILGVKKSWEDLVPAPVKTRSGEELPPGTLPEGIFFAQGLTPRILVENGRMVAVELLRDLDDVPIPDKRD
ncbi:MAG: hypothetical protein ACFFCS_12800 [Candidatus Hodarchaeota archaeon]